MSDFMSSWSQITDQIKGVTDSIKASVQENLNKVTETIQDETSKAEASLNVERQAIIEENERKKRILNGSDDLPWETSDESKMILSQDLMEQIFMIPMCDDNFTTIPDDELISSIEFDFNSFLPVIMKLMKLDSNLAAIHAKISPKMDEIEFWKNYYQRVMYLRARIGMDGDELKSTIGNVSHEKIIKRFTEVQKINKSSLSKSSEKETISITFSPKNEADGSSSSIEQKRQQQAALAAEVEAELLDDEFDGLDISEMAELDMELTVDDLDDLNDLDDVAVEEGDGDDDLLSDSLIEDQIAKELEFGDDDS